MKTLPNKMQNILWNLEFPLMLPSFLWKDTRSRISLISTCRRTLLACRYATRLDIICSRRGEVPYKRVALCLITIKQPLDFTHLPRSWHRINELIHCLYTIINHNPPGLKISALGIQGSPSTRTDVPFPIVQRIPAERTFLPSQILLQTYDGFVPKPASLKLQFLKYLFLSTLAMRQWGAIMSRHPCLAKRAKRYAVRLRNPSPPLNFSLHNRLQFIQWIFRSFPVWPHQNLAIATSI